MNSNFFPQLICAQYSKEFDSYCEVCQKRGNVYDTISNKSLVRIGYYKGEEDFHNSNVTYLRVCSNCYNKMVKGVDKEFIRKLKRAEKLSTI